MRLLETADFLNAMAKIRAQESPQILQGSQNGAGHSLERLVWVRQVLCSFVSEREALSFFHVI